MSDWTPERIERMTQLWSDGLSAKEVAQKLGGVTRNAVIGKIARLKLVRDEAAVHAFRGALRPKAVRRAWKKGAGQLAHARADSAKGFREPKKTPQGKRQLAPSRLKPEGPPAKAVVFDISLARPWLTRAFGECAYPISGEGADTHSCCQPSGAARYCLFHDSIMFVAPQTNAKSLARSLRRYAA